METIELSGNSAIFTLSNQAGMRSGGLNIDLSRFVNNLKTTSSRLLRRDFRDHLDQVYRRKPMLWSRSYCIISCGGAPLSVLKQYVEQQEAPW